jgi:O-succinylbenzoate synthase
LEEAEWFGLSMKTAVTKQALLEQQSNECKPLKQMYADELIEKLEAMIASGELKKE